MSQTTFMSPYGNPLVLRNIPKRPTLTVEDYLKWYSVFVVFPDSRVFNVNAQLYREAELTFLRKEGFSFESTWGDHVINPLFFAHLAHHFSWELDSRSYEIVVGRWVMQHEDRYTL